MRELEHLIQRLMIFTGGYTIQAIDLPPTLGMEGQTASAGATVAPGDESYLHVIQAYLDSHGGDHAHEELLEKIERLLITEALRRSHGNQTHAGRLLGLPRPTLHAKMQKFGLQGRADPPEP